MGRPEGVSLKGVLKLLNECGAAGLSHGPTRSLRDHLIGTGKILSHWGQPAEVIAGGMLHSIYSTDIYRQRLLPLTGRDSVARAAGASAERLAYLFGVLRRESFFQVVERVAGTAWRELEVDCHQGPAQVAIPRRRAGNLLVIYMANQAEQTHAADLGPGLWLSAVSRLAALAKPLVKRPPPVFDSCSAQISSHDERAALGVYNRGLALLEQNSGRAGAEFARAAARLPWVAEPAVLLSYTMVLKSAWIDGFQYATAALRRLDEWGTAWDKRLSFEEWRAAAHALADCCETAFRRPVAAARRVRESAAHPSLGWAGALRSLAIRVASNGPAAPELPRRFVTYLKTFQSRNARPKHNFYPGLRREPVHSASEFAIARAFEKSFDKIRAELHALCLDQGFQDEVERIARSGSWSTFMLYELGRRIDANCARCPVTTSLAEKHGAVHSISSAVYFSVLAPKTRVATHTGPTNMRLRCHLGIEVPSGCGLRVGTEVLTWHEGECLVFDDSFPHEVWNDSDQRRVILVADLWHPDLTRKEVDLVDGLQRYAYAHAEGMSSYWAKNERARHSNPRSAKD